MAEAFVALRLLAPLICFGMAGLLAWNKIDGWGWFLFVGVLVTPSALRVS